MQPLTPMVGLILPPRYKLFTLFNAMPQCVLLDTFKVALLFSHVGNYRGNSVPEFLHVTQVDMLRFEPLHTVVTVLRAVNACPSSPNYAPNPPAYMIFNFMIISENYFNVIKHNITT